MYGAMVVFLIGTVAGVANTEPLPPQYTIQKMGQFESERACERFLRLNYTPAGPNIRNEERSDKRIYARFRAKRETQVGPVSTFCAPVHFKE